MRNNEYNYGGLTCKICVVKMVFISLATLTFIFGLGNAQDCTALAAAGNCDFYPQCVETIIPCDTTGYALNYGEKYCRRFANFLSCFSPEVCDWNTSCISYIIIYYNIIYV